LFIHLMGTIADHWSLMVCSGLASLGEYFEKCILL
jgi:hypothetical protein